MSHIELSDINKNNIRLLKCLNQTIFPVSYNERFYRDVLVSQQLAKLAFYNDIVVGVVCCRIDQADNKKHLYIMTLGCLFTYRRLGVGTAMLKHVIDYASERKVDSIYLHVQSSNTGAIKFYQKFGFEIDGVKEDYYKRIEPTSALVLKKVMSGRQ